MFLVVCRMTLEGNRDLTTAIMDMMQEMLVMSKDMLSMIKETIDIVSRHQDQLSFLQQQSSKATKGSEKSRDKGDYQPRMRCGRCRRKHREVDCPLANGTCFRCRQHGHLVANCPLNVQGTSTQTESSSKSLGVKRPKQDEVDKRAPKNFKYDWDLNLEGM